MDNLKSEFPDWEERIENLSSYMASSGRKYTDHLATIRCWARKDKSKPKKGFEGYCVDDKEDELPLPF